MPNSKPSCAVAFPRDLKNATDSKSATNNATTNPQNLPKPSSLKELRAQLRAQPVRNLNGNSEAESDAELRMELRLQKSATEKKMLLEAEALTGELKAIRKWLEFIGEHDPRIIAEVLDNCRTDAGARNYFKRRADEMGAT
jgi:hypothetical protein